MFEQKTSLPFYPTQLLINYLDYKEIVIDDQKYWRLWENVNSKYKRVLQLVCNMPAHSENWSMSEKSAMVESVIINLYSIQDIMKRLLGETYYSIVDKEKKESIKKIYKTKYKNDPIDYRKLFKDTFLSINEGFLKKIYLNNFSDIRNGIIHGGLDFIASNEKFYIDILDFKTDSMIVFNDIYSRCDQPYHLLVDGFEFSKYYLNLIKYFCYECVSKFINSCEEDKEIYEFLHPILPNKINLLEEKLDILGSRKNISFSIENYEKDLISVKGYKKRLFDTEKDNLKEINKINNFFSRGTDLVENYQEIMIKSFFGRCGLFISIKKYAEELIVFVEKHIYEKIRNDFHKFCHEFSLEFQEISDSTNNYLLVFKKSYFLNCWMRKDLDLGRLSKRYK